MTTDTELLRLFHAERGIVCAAGAGGKKTILYRLAQAHGGRIALTNSVFSTVVPQRLVDAEIVAPGAELLARARRATGRVAYSTPTDKPGRNAGVDPDLIEQIHLACEFDTTFVKADGARMRWMKAPRAGEPVLPPSCSTLIVCVSARILGEPLSESVAHRVSELEAVIGCKPGQIVTPEHVAKLMVSDNGMLRGAAQSFVVPVINMVDAAGRIGPARRAAELALAQTDRFDYVVLAQMASSQDPVANVVERP
jgi:probable selenium-dependent hydroxylase accessory protein YqeC